MKLWLPTTPANTASTGIGVKTRIASNLKVAYSLQVDETRLCKEQLQIDVFLTDKNDDWVGDAEMIIESPRSSGTALIEVGVNREDFQYFMVGEVWCYSGVPTVEAFL